MCRPGGVDEVRASAPVFIADRIHPRVTLKASRLTSRADRGIRTFFYEVVNQDAAVVMTFTSSLVIARRTGLEEDQLS